MKKEEKTTPVTKSAELVALEEEHGTIYTIEGTDKHGNTLTMYLKKPDYQLRKNLLVGLVGAKESDPMMATITAGETVLLTCYVGGINLHTDEETRLEAALKAAEIVEINDSFRLKKN